MSALNIDRLLNVGLARYQEDQIDYSANNPKTTEIVRQHPISHLECRLSGNLVVATASATLDEPGAAGLIESIDVIIDGSDVPIHIPGFMLRMLTWMYSGSPPYNSAPAVTVGTNAFVFSFVIPIDIGGNLTLLDASRANSLVVRVQWGDETDMATAGAGGTIAVSSVKLDIDTVAVSGAPAGSQGGVGWPYPRHVLNFQHTTITAADTEKVFNLHKSHVYRRLLLWTKSDAASANTILNSATLVLGTLHPMKVAGPMMQEQNVARYDLATTQTGVYVFDFTQPGALEQMLTLQGSQRFDLQVDVAHPGATDEIWVVADKLIVPRAA